MFMKINLLIRKDCKMLKKRNDLNYLVALCFLALILLVSGCSLEPFRMRKVTGKSLGNEKKIPKIDPYNGPY